MISIVTLTYNRANSLFECLSRIRENTSNDFEMIVVDNGSTDGTGEIVKHFFPEVTLILLDENKGVWVRNFGFERAKGEFIAQVDDDVLVLPHWDEILLEYMTEGVGAVGPSGWFFQSWERPNEGKPAKAGNFVDFLTGYCFLMRNNKEFRYDERFFFWHEDLDLSFKIKFLGYRLRQSKLCCIHLSERQGVDWKLHNENLALVREKWQNQNLNFEIRGTS